MAERRSRTIKYTTRGTMGTPPDAERPGREVEILKAQVRHLRATHAGEQEDRDHREVAPASKRRLLAEFSEDSLLLVNRQPRRQASGRRQARRIGGRVAQGVALA